MLSEQVNKLIRAQVEQIISEQNTLCAHFIHANPDIPIDEIEMVINKVKRGNVDEIIFFRRKVVEGE